MELGTDAPSVTSETPAASSSASPTAVPLGPIQQSGMAPKSPEAPVQPPAHLGEGLASLTLRRAGALTNETFALGDRVTIGRFDVETGPVDVDMGLMPEGAYLSRHHAEMWRDTSGRWFVKDLGSQNGTFVRPASSTQFQRVAEGQAVSDGDEIAFGNARFEFRTA